MFCKLLLTSTNLVEICSILQKKSFQPVKLGLIASKFQPYIARCQIVNNGSFKSIFTLKSLPKTCIQSNSIEQETIHSQLYFHQSEKCERQKIPINNRTAHRHISRIQYLYVLWHLLGYYWQQLHCRRQFYLNCEF